MSGSTIVMDASPIAVGPSRLNKGFGLSKVKTIEERYQKKTPIEHILHRPESYIGSVQSETQQLWIWDQTTHKMVYQQIEFVPGLYKIFDEILVNAADVKAREESESRSSDRKRQRMTSIQVEINQQTSLISVFNDGEGIPIEVHKEYKVYVPELIFGHLLTSDNYDDAEERVTGGRNGYGAKLANIFSTKFTVECVDSARKRKFVKTWRNNMSSSDPCSITQTKETKDYVKISFKPDLQRFKLTHLTDDVFSLLIKRVYDIAGCCGVKVWFNGQKLLVDNFKSYVGLYFPKELSNSSSGSGDQELSTATSAKSAIKIHEKSGRWEVIISMSEGQFQQVSFVNSICTTKGGTHVNYVAEPLIQAILKKVNLKNKGGIDIKVHHIKAHLWIFVNCLIVNPTFDSQTKETLTLKSSQFGSKFCLSEKTIQSVIKSEILDSVLMWARAKQQVELQKKMKGATGRSGRDRISGIPKLEDANDAGTRYSETCTLILTEGESAKTSCVAGLSVVGKDRYGVFPLRGKLLNVREASFKQQIENQEIQAILKIMGLQVGKNIDSPKGLRYGSLMLMTDQDLDGSHIKGLLINMIAHYWPGLLKFQGFLKQFITPIVKVSKNNRELSFFTLTEYENWKQEHDNGKGWKIRYYKGLGTSTDREFKDYFSCLGSHLLEFSYSGDEDLNAIDMAFNGKRAEDRKQWIQSYQENTYIDYTQSRVTYSEFINKELVVFSKYDAFRSIPNCIDGFKPVQRKVLFAAFKRNLKTEIKVAQFSGYISEKTAYHHGEQSLGATVIGMAQNFVGSNNIALLEPCGQFGSRKEGGKDASAVRYIFTRLAVITRIIFPEVDDPLLDYQNDDGLMVEPKYYMPIIPMVLVNGAEGIGTGWSSFIPSYNPIDLIANIRRFIKGETLEAMTPWYRGFKGTIERKENGSGFESVGIIRKTGDCTVSITELPVKMWTQNFKQFLEDCFQDRSEATDNAPNRSRGGTTTGARGQNSTGLSILDYRDNSTHAHIHFTVTLTEEQMRKAENEGLEKAFRLRKALGTTNMTLFDQNLKVQRYVTELDIIREFGQLRLQYYQLRREYIIEKHQRECQILRNKVRFIEAIVSGSLVISNRKRDAIVADLVKQKFDTLTQIHQASKLMWKLEKQRQKIESELNTNETENTLEDEEEKEKIPSKEFEYLLGMSLWSLTLEKIKELQTQLKSNTQELEKVQQETAESLWESDLVALEKSLESLYSGQEEDFGTDVFTNNQRNVQTNKRILKNQRAQSKKRASKKSKLFEEEEKESLSETLLSSSSDDESSSNLENTKKLNNKAKLNKTSKQQSSLNKKSAAKRSFPVLLAREEPWTQHQSLENNNNSSTSSVSLLSRIRQRAATTQMSSDQSTINKTTGSKIIAGKQSTLDEILLGVKVPNLPINDAQTTVSSTPNLCGSSLEELIPPFEQKQQKKNKEKKCHPERTKRQAEKKTIVSSDESFSSDLDGKDSRPAKKKRQVINQKQRIQKTAESPLSSSTSNYSCSEADDALFSDDDD